MKAWMALAACAALVGCVSTSDITQTGANSYSVSANGDDTRSLRDTREKTLEAAQAKCQSMDKTVQVISDRNERKTFGGSVFPRHTLNFRCL